MITASISAVVTPGDNLAHELMRLPDADAGLAHQGDFAFGFELNHGS